DGSSNGNPPERCPFPLYSWDSPQEGHTIPHRHQDEEIKGIKAEIKEEEEETLDGGAWQSVEEGEMIIKSKQEKSSLHIDINGSSKRNPPERCPRPLYSRDSTQEDLTIPHHDEDEELKDIKAEVKEEEEEMLVSGAQQSMEEGEMIIKSKQEESAHYINTNGLHVSPDCDAKNNDVKECSPGVNPIPQNIHHRPYHLETARDPSNPEEPPGQSHTGTSDIHLRSADPSLS
ncbi:hypothetical protein AB205_0005660, partial [Aquarana catesbeiana]